LLRNHRCEDDAEGSKSPFPQGGAGKGSGADEQTPDACKEVAWKAGAHEVSPEIPGSIDVPTIEAISDLKTCGGVYTS
jgi:hypothetical protein